MDRDDLNDLHIEDVIPPEGIIDNLLKIVDTHPLLTFIFFCSIIYLIHSDINRQNGKK